jgi:hypothetical protein
MRAVLALAAALCLTACCGADNSNIIGSTHWAGCYALTTQPYLLEGAQVSPYCRSVPAVCGAVGPLRSPRGALQGEVVQSYALVCLDDATPLT